MHTVVLASTAYTQPQRASHLSATDIAVNASSSMPTVGTHMLQSARRLVPKTLVLSIASSADDVLKRVDRNVRAQPMLDFAVILYKGSVKQWKPIQNKLMADAHLRLMVRRGKQPPGTLVSRRWQASPRDGSLIPKLWFQMQAADWIDPYDYIWTVDDDINFEGFPLTRFFRRHATAFSTGAPVLAQPTIAKGSHEPFWMTNHEMWPNQVKAAVTNHVEQQAALIDTGFWKWLVPKLELVKQEQLKRHHDWGLDVAWCAAAEDFVKSPSVSRDRQWRPYAFCDGHRANERAQWLMDHQGMEREAAQQQVMSEFPDVFADRAGGRTACSVITVPITDDDTRSIGWRDRAQEFTKDGIRLVKWLCDWDPNMRPYLTRPGSWPPRPSQVWPASYSLDGLVAEWDRRGYLEGSTGGEHSLCEHVEHRCGVLQCNPK